MKIKREVLKSQLRSVRLFIDGYKRIRGDFPDESLRVWTRLEELIRSMIEHNWSRKGLSLELDNPKTLAEKLEWLKLNYHDELLFEVTDKIPVRDYVIKTTGDSGLLNEILALYDRVDDIDANQLPETYVLKPSHWSGNVFVVSPDNPLNPQAASILNNCLRRRYARVRRSTEWPYWSHHPAKLIAENYLEDQYSQLVDYKWFCFQGVPRFVMVCKDRFVDHKRLFFDPDWNLLPFSDARYPTFPPAEISPPNSLHQMRTVAQQLSRDFPFIRVDLYDINGICKFGELTPYPEAGIDSQFIPEDWNLKIGDWLELPQPKINRRLAYSRFVV